MIDFHCHLTDERIFNQAERMIQKAREGGVLRIGLGGTDPADWARQSELKKRYPDLIYTHYGLHPWWVNADDQSVLEVLRQHISECDGIGETGLDFGRKQRPETFPFQEQSFRDHLKIALHFQKPVVLHVVAAHERAQRIIQEEFSRVDVKSHVPLILHRYSGGLEYLSAYLELGCFFSWSGEIAHPHGGKKSKEAFKIVPLERIFLETDAPDQGQEPAQINEFYRAAAEIRGIPIENLVERIAENFRLIY